MEKEKKKKKKGPYGKVLGFCILAGCVAALLGAFGSGGLGSGLWPFGDSGSGNNSDSGTNGASSTEEYTPENNAADTPQENEASDNAAVYEPEAPEEPAAAGLVIRVYRDTIFHGDEEIDIEGLEQIIEELNYDGADWELVEEQSLEYTRNLVLATMEAAGISPRRTII